MSSMRSVAGVVAMPVTTRLSSSSSFTSSTEYARFMSSTYGKHNQLLLLHRHRMRRTERHHHRNDRIDLVRGFLLGQPSVVPLVLLHDRRHDRGDQRRIAAEPHPALEHRVLKQSQRSREPKSFGLLPFALRRLDHFVSRLSFLRPALRVLN